MISNFVFASSLTIITLSILRNKRSTTLQMGLVREPCKLADHLADICKKYLDFFQIVPLKHFRLSCLASSPCIERPVAQILGYSCILVILLVIGNSLLIENQKHFNNNTRSRTLLQSLRSTLKYKKMSF